MQRWLPPLWLAFVVIRYGKAALTAVLLPYNDGSDVAWAVTWVALMLVVAGSAMLLQQSTLNRSWSGVLTASALAIVLLSHSMLPAILGLAILAVAAGFGEFMLQRLTVERGTLPEHLVMTVPIGLGFLALGQLGLALAGLFNPVATGILVACFALPGISGIRRLLALQGETSLAKHGVALVPCGLVFLLNLTWAVAPEIQYDSLNVHLAVPKLYLQAGRLVDLPYFFNSYFAHLLDMVFGICLALGGAATVKFLVLGLGMLAAVGVYVLGRRVFNAEVGVWAALLFYSTPLIIWSSSTAYLDLPLALFVTASTIAFLRWQETSHWAWMAVTGWIAGVAVGTKTAAIATLLVFPAAAAVRAFRRRSLPVLWAAVACALLVLIVAVPWHAVVYAQTGNPFFPLLNGIFQSPNWPAENTNLDLGTVGVGTSWGALLRIPFRLVWDTSRFSTARGAVGFALLLVFPLAFRYVWRGTAFQRTVLLVIAIHVTVWAFTAQYGRYMISILPFVAVAGCGALFEGLSRPATRCSRALLFAGVVAQASAASVLFWNIPERFPLEVSLGRETHEAFLSRSVPAYRAAHFLNDQWKSGEKILGAGVEESRFYFDGPLYTQHYLNLANFRTPADLRDTIAASGFQYIAVSRIVLRDPPGWLGYVQPAFLEEFGEALYKDESAVVFRIRNR